MEQHRVLQSWRPPLPCPAHRVLQLAVQQGRPRGAVDPRPSLEAFKARLDGALGSLGCCEMWRLVALPVVWGGLELRDP